MYEEKKNGEIRTIALRLFADLPWAVRAFFNLLVAVLIAIFIFGAAGHFMGVKFFGEVASQLTGFLKLIIGAIIGALSAEAKRVSDTSKHVQRNDSKVADNEHSQFGEHKSAVAKESSISNVGMAE